MRPMSDDDQILFEERGPLRLVTLNRPKAFNALTLEMIEAFHPRLQAWAADPAVAAVAVRGAGEKAFCAGGDILDIYRGRGAGRNLLGERFFAAEYRLNRLIKVFPKPYIALLDGVTMGGGVGVSVHGSFRVASEGCLLAMPETGIGLYPDVGASYVLPRLPDAMGLLIGLTGWRLGAADCCQLGIATHFLPQDRQEALLAALAAAPWGEGDGYAVADRVLAAQAVPAPASDLAGIAAEVAAAFGAGSLPAVLAALAASDADWANKALALLKKASPTSLCLTFETIRRGAALDFDAAMRMEYRVSCHCLKGHDFYEGVRALLVDKDRNPRWQPASLDAVDPAGIDAAFATRGAEDLTFETPDSAVFAEA